MDVDHSSGRGSSFSAGGGADTYIVTQSFANAADAGTDVIIDDAGTSDDPTIVLIERGVEITGVTRDATNHTLGLSFATGGTETSLTIRQTGTTNFKLGENGVILELPLFLAEIKYRGDGALTNAYVVGTSNAPPEVSTIPTVRVADTAGDDTFTPLSGQFMATDDRNRIDGFHVVNAAAPDTPAERLTPEEKEANIDLAPFTHKVVTTYGTLFYVAPYAARAPEINGTWQFYVNDAAVESLNTGQTQTLRFSVTAHDTASSGAAKNLVITFTGADEVVDLTAGHAGSDAIFNTSGTITYTITQAFADATDGSTNATIADNAGVNVFVIEAGVEIHSVAYTAGSSIGFGFKSTQTDGAALTITGLDADTRFKIGAGGSELAVEALLGEIGYNVTTGGTQDLTDAYTSPTPPRC